MSSLGYDRTVSIIDLNTFTVTKTIDVGINLFRLRSDKYGNMVHRVATTIRFHQTFML